MDSNPIHHPSPAKKWNAHFCITFNIWCWPDWSMDLNLIHHPSPAKRMKCSFLGYIQLLMISRAVRWTQTSSATPLQPKKMKCSFLDYVHFWWSAWLIDELESHLKPLSYQRNEMLNFRLRSTSDDQPSWSIDSKSICQPSPANKMKYSFLDYVQLLMISWAGQWTQTPFTTCLLPKKWNAHILIMFNFWWLAGLVNGLKPHPPPLSIQKNELLIVGLRSTSDDWPGWSMDWNSLCQPSPAKNMKCYFLDSIQLLMIGWAGQWTQTPSSTPLQPKKWNAHFCITFNIWCWPDWSMDLNLIHHSSPANNMKCSFLGYILLLMISWAVRWTQTPSATPLQPIKWNAHFWITFNFWWSAGLVNGLEPHPPPVSRQKN